MPRVGDNHPSAAGFKFVGIHRGKAMYMGKGLNRSKDELDALEEVEEDVVLEDDEAEEEE